LLRILQRINARKAKDISLFSIYYGEEEVISQSVIIGVIIHNKPHNNLYRISNMFNIVTFEPVPSDLPVMLNISPLLLVPCQCSAMMYVKYDSIK